MDTERVNQPRSWQINLLLTGGIMITVLLALIMAQLDTLQVRAAVARPGIPIVNIQATAIAVGNTIPLNLNPAMPVSVEELVNTPPDDLNPRPEFITGVSEEGIIFTVCGEVPEGWLLYTIQPGETLASVAAGTQTGAAELAAANCLEEGEFSAGMQVLVPRQPVVALCGPPSWWVRYVVQPGDTLGGLAFNRRTTVDEVLRANCRDAIDLQAGQSIFLPPGFQPGPAAPIPQPSLTPLPSPTDVPTLVPLPSATPPPDQPPPPTNPPAHTAVPPTATPPPLPTAVPPSLTPQLPPTEPPPTQTPQPPTEPPPTVAPTVTPPLPPTEPPPTATAVTPPTEPPPTDPPPPEEGG